MNATGPMRLLRRRGWLPRILAADPRTSRQVEDDLNAEFEFHIEQRIRQLQSEGVDAEQARALAVTSFGDVEAIKRQCRRIAMKERTMLKRIHLAVTIVLLLALLATAFLAFQMYRTAAQHREMAVVMRMQARQAEHQAQQEAAKAAATSAFLQEALAAADAKSAPRLDVHELLDQAEARLPEFADQPGLQQQVRERIAEARAKVQRDDGAVRIEGAVQRPGAYALPPGSDLTLRRLVAAAGGFASEHNVAIAVTRTIEGQRKIIRTITAEQWRNDLGLDESLHKDDLVTVVEQQ